MSPLLMGSERARNFNMEASYEKDTRFGQRRRKYMRTTDSAEEPKKLLLAPSFYRLPSPAPGPQ